jgi:hypothetical protein
VEEKNQRTGLHRRDAFARIDRAPKAPVGRFVRLRLGSRCAALSVGASRSIEIGVPAKKIQTN